MFEAITATQALQLAKKFTRDTANALGAVKGDSCKAKVIEETPGEHKVIFEWTGDDGTKETETMIVRDGEGNIEGLTQEQRNELKKLLQ